MGKANNTLDQLRSRIDMIDLQLLQMLNQRAAIVIEIQKVKGNKGLPAYSGSRESEILERLKAANTGPFPDAAIEDIFRKILQHSLSSLGVTWE